MDHRLGPDPRIRRRRLDRRERLVSLPSRPAAIRLGTPEDFATRHLPDVLARWQQREADERQRSRTEQSFCVPKADIAANSYDLSLNRYKEVEHEEVEHRDPKDILADLWKLEEEIQTGMKELGAML